MAPLKTKGDLAELKVAADLADRGYRILFPYGEDNDYDLCVEADGSLLRVQVKYTDSHGEVVHVKCTSHSLTNGRVRQTKKYTAETIDVLAVYDRSSGCIYYIPAKELGSGRSIMHLRLTETRNGQKIGIRRAENYREFPRRRTVRLPLMEVVPSSTLFMEPAGFEPAASSVQAKRSAN